MNSFLDSETLREKERMGRERRERERRERETQNGPPFKVQG